MKKNWFVILVAALLFSATVTTDVFAASEKVTSIFSDVYEGQWYVESVQYAYERQIMTGMKGTTQFGPDASITRAQVAQVLYNLEGQPEITDRSACDEMGDVYTDWYTDAVCWAYANGIVTGHLDTMTFHPNDNVTREQLAAMLYRYTDYKGFSTEKTSDLRGLSNASKVSSWAKTEICWAVGSKLISGIEKGNVKDLAPQGAATRAQTATIFMRFLENIAKEIDSFKLNYSAKDIVVGESFTLQPVTIPGTLPNAAITWTSADESIATVENGVVTAHSNGTVMITAKAGYRSAYCSVVVVDHITEFEKLWVVEDQFAVKINSFEKHYPCNNFSDKTGDVVVLVNYTYYNYGYTGYYQDLYIHEYSFDVYDGNGVAGSPYPCTHVTYPKVCAPGTNCTATAAFILDEDTEMMKLVLEEYTSNGTGKKKAVFDLPLNKKTEVPEQPDLPEGGDEDWYKIGAENLKRYIVENGFLDSDSEYMKINRKETVDGHEFTVTITYRDDLEILIFHYKDEKDQAIVSFDYDIANANVTTKASFGYFKNSSAVLAYSNDTFDIRSYTLDTDLVFEVDMNMLSGLTESQIIVKANNHLKLAIANFGLLLTERGMTMESIGFSNVENALE